MAPNSCSKKKKRVNFQNDRKATIFQLLQVLFEDNNIVHAHIVSLSKSFNILKNKKRTAVPIKTFSDIFPDCREASVRAQKLHWTGKETCWSASSPYFFPGMNTETVFPSRTEEIKKRPVRIPVINDLITLVLYLTEWHPIFLFYNVPSLPTCKCHR